MATQLRDEVGAFNLKVILLGALAAFTWGIGNDIYNRRIKEADVNQNRSVERYIDNNGERFYSVIDGKSLRET